MGSQNMGPTFKTKCGSLQLSRLEELTGYTSKFLTETEELIKTVIPAKVLELEKLRQSEHFNNEDMSCIHESLGIPSTGLKHQVHFEYQYPHNCAVIQNSKKRKLDEEKSDSTGNQIVINNPKLHVLIQLLKPEVKQLIETCAKIQMWIQLLIPKIEDGNNFGVSIQEEILSEVNRIQTDAASYLDQISRYYITRAKLASKVVKYPFLGDYRRSVEEIDEKEYLSLRNNCTDIRNNYLLLLDIIVKNYEKIKRPRTSNADSMY